MLPSPFKIIFLSTQPSPKVDPMYKYAEVVIIDRPLRESFMLQANVSLMDQVTMTQVLHLGADYRIGLHLDLPDYEANYEVIN
jgi:hypothetical protein